ncbi:MAG: hypothetical protein ACPGVO_13735, partial [Spirulinaceae cyanobacterium]
PVIATRDRPSPEGILSLLWGGVPVGGGGSAYWNSHQKLSTALSVHQWFETRLHRLLCPFIS